MGSKLDIDLKTNEDYVTILSTLVDVSVTNENELYAAFAFTSPVSSNVSPNSTLFLNNFHIQGNTSEPTYEIVDNIPFVIDTDPEYQVFDNNLTIIPKE